MVFQNGIQLFHWSEYKPAYFLGNFLSRADFLWAKEVEWISPCPSSPSEPLSADWYEFESESDCLSISCSEVHLCFLLSFHLEDLV